MISMPAIPLNLEIMLNKWDDTNQYTYNPPPPLPPPTLHTNTILKVEIRKKLSLWRKLTLNAKYRLNTEAK